MVTVDLDRCKGCGLCVGVCPKKIVELSDNDLNSKGYYTAELTDPGKCISCAFCAMMCPDMAITVTEGA